MKTRPIGERFKDGGVTLEVEEEASGCKGCYYDGYYLCIANHELAGACDRVEREDKKSVIFNLVEP